jgi:hypothetical protein
VDRISPVRNVDVNRNAQLASQFRSHCPVSAPPKRSAEDRHTPELQDGTSAIQ